MELKVWVQISGFSEVIHTQQSQAEVYVLCVSVSQGGVGGCSITTVVVRRS